MADAAPYFDAVAEGSPDGMADGKAEWIDTSDGLRLRAVRWGLGDATRGTVLIFQGRTEYIEKYGPLASDLVRAGYGSVAIDWRGQGLSDRLLADRLSGHVGLFPDYQRDVAALVSHLDALKAPRPFHLVAHSMGGAIGLRALAEGLAVERAVFSAPMWGIAIAAHLRPVAWALSTLGRRMGLAHLYAPGGSARAYPSVVPFAENMLTTDEIQFARMASQIETQPDLAVGGPSLGWLGQALIECHRLAEWPAPDTPCLTLLGSDERVVDPRAIRRRMAHWPNGELMVLEGARHECLMEAAPIRDRAMSALLAHLAG